MKISLQDRSRLLNLNPTHQKNYKINDKLFGLPYAFKDIALHFYQNQQELRDLREKLQNNFSNIALINSKNYTKYLKRAFVKIHEKRLMNEPNDHVILS